MINKNFSEKIESCVIASAWIKPESQVTDNLEIYKVENEQSPFGFLNGVYRTRFSSGKADELICKHFNSFKSRKINFRWYCFPHSLPDDLYRKLKSLNPNSITKLSGLYCDTSDIQIKSSIDVTVEELCEDNLEDYCRASNEGWEQTGAAALKIVDDTRRELISGKMGHRAFLARFKGEPASTGLVRMVGDGGYLLGGSTSPRFRKKGVYRALVRHRINLLKDAKIPLALILARKETSAPICLSLGFKVGCECASFDFNF